MRINTNQDAARAIERLRTRDPEFLAALIVSLAQDAGPVGEQVRTFIVGDDVKEASMSLKERIESLSGCSEREHRSRRGQEVGQRLEFILDAVETLVVPLDPKGALSCSCWSWRAMGLPWRTVAITTMRSRAHSNGRQV